MVCLRSRNMPLSEMKKYVELTQYGKESISERKEMMLKHKKKVEDLYYFGTQRKFGY